MLQPIVSFLFFYIYKMSAIMSIHNSDVLFLLVILVRLPLLSFTILYLPAIISSKLWFWLSLFLLLLFHLIWLLNSLRLYFFYVWNIYSFLCLIVYMDFFVVFFFPNIFLFQINFVLGICIILCPVKYSLFIRGIYSINFH